MNEEQSNALLELLSGLYIQSLRNYDILMFLADKLGVDIDKIEQMHQEGRVLCPDPALVFDDEDENS